MTKQLTKKENREITLKSENVIDTKTLTKKQFKDINEQILILQARIISRNRLNTLNKKEIKQLERKLGN